LNDIGPDIETAGVEKIRGYLGKSAQYPTWMHAAHHLRAGFREAYPNWRIEDWLGFAKRLCKLQPSGRITFDYDMRIAEPFRVPGGEAGVDLWKAFDGLKSVPTLLVRGARSNILSEATAAGMQRRKPDLMVADVPDTGHAPLLDEPAAVTAIDRLLSSVE
ncbi:MAG: alpha/beta hydrolase, partial [Sphingomonadales bacterium]|nr:alpha/beta hydrolase [Sphingomonadales bacterium]